MKTLTLLRHAKSSWDDAVARDFDRPLNRKGQRAAEAMGRHAKTLGLTFDHVVASPAERVVETLKHFATGYGEDLTPQWDAGVYLASTATLLDVVHALPETADSVLLVGHNPGFEELVLLLTSEGPLRDDVEIKFPTASLAELHFQLPGWAKVMPATASLARFVRPRDLDSNFGPDAP